MRFTNHSNLEGRHAYLSPSQYHWMNYTDEKFDRVFTARMASARGTALHQLALDLIRLGVKLPDVPKTMNLYVNDCIGYRMTPEQPVYYSDNAFGTPDAISFRDDLLRIFDLKTGLHPASVHQLEVYAALFCLEYRFKPHEIKYDIRIYQNDEVKVFEIDPGDILRIADRIQTFDKRLNELKEEALW